MRIHVIPRLAVSLTVALAAACSNSGQPPKDPINADPKPQAAINHPEPQGRGPSLGLEDQPQKPITEQAPQQPTLGEPSSPGAMSHPEPQKPFYGPGLTSPDEKTAEHQKAKAPLANDGEVLSFAMAVNDSELQMAEFAKKTAENPEVKNFAVTVLTQHQQGMAKIRSLQSKTKIELKNNELATKVKNDADQNVAMLRDKKGKEFDRLYIDTQVRMHKDALDALDNRVLPAVSNGEVKTSMNEMRRQVSDHLAKAEQIQKKIDPTLAKAHESSDDKAKKAKTDEKKKQDMQH